MVARLFISYVRDDTEADANALYQSLRSVFGDATIYKDTNEIPLGANWKETVRAAIDASVAVLWVIGPSWAPSDSITLELRHAMDRNVPVIPVLMRGADIEAATESLADELSALGDLNAATMRHASWDRDLTPLLERLRDLGLGATHSVTSGTSFRQNTPIDADVIPRARVLETSRGRFVFELTLTSESHVIEALTVAKTRVNVNGHKVKVRTSPRWIKFDVPSQHGELAARLKLSGWGRTPTLAALRVTGRPVPVVQADEP